MTKRSSNSRIWNDARTRIAISSRLCGWPRAVIALELLDLLADRAGFFLGVPAGGDLHLLAGHVLGAQRLAEAAFVVRDQMRGGGEDVGGGAVVALQADDLGAGEIVVEAQDVVDLGAAPAVDRLVVVADAADVFLVEFCAADSPAPHSRWRRRGARLGRGSREAPVLASSILVTESCRPSPDEARLRRAPAMTAARRALCDCPSNRSHRYCATFVS